MLPVTLLYARDPAQFFLHSAVGFGIVRRMSYTEKRRPSAALYSLQRVLNSAVAWAQFSTALRLVGIAVVLMVGVRILPPDELGLWYTLSTMAALSGAIELGFHGTIARFAGYFMAGKDRIQAIGVSGGAIGVTH